MLKNDGFYNFGVCHRKFFSRKTDKKSFQTTSWCYKTKLITKT